LVEFEWWSNPFYGILHAMRKHRNFSTDRCYHLVSRVANRAFYFSEEERSRFVERMWRVAYFTCVEVLAYCVMSNHFHILVYVPIPRKLNEEEILARVKALYRGPHLLEILKEWEDIVRQGATTRREEFLDRFSRRMWSASEFMKTLKQTTSQSFNARLKHDGTMWESRFHARMLMPDEKAEMMKAAGYIDRNPVKAGVVKWPDEYKWCGFAAACAGDVRAQEGYRFIYTFAPVDWPRAKELHEISIGLALKELEEDREAKSAAGSHGGEKISVTADKLDGIKRRRWAEMEQRMPKYIPRILSRGNNKIARDLLVILAEGPRRPAELRSELGVTSANYFTERYLTPMRRAGFIERENVGKPHDPHSTYRITAKGKKALV
jgi:REP element-mobilizing transposase RayT/DNA-binding HxlR family transcriptional regulator